MPFRYIDLIPEDFSEDFSEEPTRDGRETYFKVKTPLGWRIIDSPYNPTLEISRTIVSVVTQGDVVLALGAGSGYLAEELIARKTRKALLITGSRALAENNIRRLREKSEFPPDILLIAADSTDRLWRTYILPFLKEEPTVRIVNHTRETAAYPALFGALALHIESYRFPIVHKPSLLPQKIMMPGSGGLMERELDNEFRRRGIEVISTESFTDNRISPEKAWKMLCEHKPDLVFSVNNQGSDPGGLIPQACETAGIPWATWMLDDPRFILTPEETTGMGKERVGFCWDVNGIESWRGLGFPHADPLPLATDPAHFTPGEGDPSLTGRIVFVGRPRFARAEGYFAALEYDPHARLLAESFERWVIQNRAVPGGENIDEAIALKGLEGHFSPEARRRLPAFIVQQANQNYRIAALHEIADLRPVVFGLGWEGLLPDTVELRGPLDYYRDLVHIYRSDAVHLSLTNLQMRAYPNQRVFDIGACGRGVLNDRLEGWSALFGNDYEDLIFGNWRELREKVVYFMNNAALRNRLGEKLQDLVMKKHTIAQRVERIFKILSLDNSVGANPCVCP